MVPKYTSLALVIFFFSFLLLLPLLGYSSGSLECQIQSEKDEDCTPHLTLDTANLVISSDGGFHLTGTYSACYHIEEVYIEGKVLRRFFPDGMSIELLATEIRLKQSGLIESFPRTIGTLTLKEAPLQGYFFDSWVSIMTGGTSQPDPFATPVSCLQKTDK